MVVVSDLSKNTAGLTDLAEKRHGSADLYTPIQPLEKGRVHVIAITKHGCINYRIIASTKKIVFVRMAITVIYGLACMKLT